MPSLDGSGTGNGRFSASWRRRVNVGCMPVAIAATDTLIQIEGDEIERSALKLELSQRTPITFEAFTGSNEHEQTKSSLTSYNTNDLWRPEYRIQ